VCRNPKILFPLLPAPCPLPPCCLNDKYSTGHDIRPIFLMIAGTLVGFGFLGLQIMSGKSKKAKATA
jgi:hypothetical protein